MRDFRDRQPGGGKIGKLRSRVAGRGPDCEGFPSNQYGQPCGGKIGKLMSGVAGRGRDREDHPGDRD